jgi:hypothetical protein
MIPTVETDSDFNASKIKCPVCGGNFSHTLDITRRPGEDRAGSAWAGRGNVDVIEFEGECGHYWALCLGFHKGETYMFMAVRCP